MTTPPWTAAEFARALTAERDIADDEPEDEESDTDLAPIEIGEPVGEG